MLIPAEFLYNFITKNIYYNRMLKTMLIWRIIMPKYRIITFDGGGIRTILGITLLNRISMYFPELAESTDLFSGASAGAIIALALSAGISPEELLNTFSMKNIRYVFSDKYIGLNKPIYGNSMLYKKLSLLLTDYMLLGDLKHHVIIPSFNIAGTQKTCWHSDLYNNFPDSKYLNEKIIDTAMCSSACPVYFPSFKNHIDGGIIANNPSSIALAFAINKLPEDIEMKDICLLSFGSGRRHHRISDDTSHWGALQWTLKLDSPMISPLLSVVSAGISDSNYQTTRLLLDDNFFRIDPKIPCRIAVDEYRRIPQLKKIAYDYDIMPVVEWLKKKWV
jgi:patatin-like phospholipase/acyl hydrolase